MTLLRSSPSSLSVFVTITLSIGVLVGCASNTAIRPPSPPSTQDPFVGLPITKPAEQTPLEDVLIEKNRQGPRFGILLSGNTKAAQRYAGLYWDALDASAGHHESQKHSGNVAVTPVLEAIEESLEQATRLEKWEEAKRTGVDLVALVDLSCSLPDSPMSPASYAIGIYMLTPDGHLLSAIKVTHTEASTLPQQMLAAGMMGRAIDNTQGGSAKSFATYEQKFMDDARTQSGQGQIVLRAARAVSKQTQRKLGDFLEEFDEAQAFSKMMKTRR